MKSDKSRAFALLLALLVVPILSAQSALTATYVEGSAEVAGSPVDIGTQFSGAEVLILGPSAYVELEGRGRSYKLLGPGEYPLSDLAPGDSGARGLSTAVGGRMRRLLRDSARGDLAVAGVRGDFAGEDSFDMGGPGTELRSAAADALRAGRPTAAEELYREALLYAMEGETAAIKVELAELLLGREKPAEAAEVLSDVSPDSLQRSLPPEWRGRYALARGAALMGTEDWAVLLDHLTVVEAKDYAGETQLYLALMEAEAALQLGDPDRAATALERVIATAPDSPEATLARRLLSEE